MRGYVTLASYLLAGAIWHLWIYGPVQWDSIMSWGVIVFWPMVIGWIALKWTVLAAITVAAIVACGFAYAAAAESIDIWRLRRKTRHEIKANKESNAKSH